MMYITMMLITGISLLVLFWVVPLIVMCVGLAVTFIEDGDIGGYMKPDWLEWVFDKCDDIIDDIFDDGCYIVVSFLFSIFGGILFPLTILAVIACCVVWYLRYKKMKLEK